MNKSIFYFLVIILALEIFCVHVKELQVQNRINQIECQEGNLRINAPETLYEPPSFSFDTIEHYNEALIHYKLGGTWATLSDGFECKI